MGFMSSLDIAASGLTAQQMRIDVLSQNLVNADTTRTENGEPYRRKMVVFQERPGDTFGNYLSRARQQTTPGVKVAAVVEDQRALKAVYDPTHPDANEDGYVMMPNVDKIKEMSDLMSASNAYTANLTTISVLKLMASRALEIGK